MKTFNTKQVVVFKASFRMKIQTESSSLQKFESDKRTILAFMFSISPHLRVDPARDCVAEEDEVRDNSAGVDTDHLAHSSERGVLLIVIPNVSQTRAPRPDKLKKRRSDNLGADKTHPTNSDRSVLQQRLRGVLSVYM